MPDAAAADPAGATARSLPDLAIEVIAATRAGLTRQEIVEIYRVPRAQVDAILADAPTERPARRRWLRLVRRTRSGRGGRTGGTESAAAS